MIVWLASLAWGCEPVRVDELQANLDEAQSAFADADLDRFATAVGTVEAAMPCLVELAPPAVIAQVHRMEGMSSFFSGDRELAPQAFAAARRVEPNYRFPVDLVPIGNPLLDAYHTADPYGMPDQPVPPPSEGSVRFDGNAELMRPGGVPTLFQRVDRDGAVAATQYLWPNDPTPFYEEAKVRPQRSLKLPMAVGAASSAALTGILFGANAAVHAKYTDVDTPSDQLDGLRASNNRLVVASGVGLAATLGFGGAVVFVK